MVIESILFIDFFSTVKKKTSSLRGCSPCTSISETKLWEELKRRRMWNGSNNGSHTRRNGIYQHQQLLVHLNSTRKKWRLLKRPQNQVQNHWLNSVIHHEVVKVIFVLVELPFPLLALHPSFLSRYKLSSILWQVSFLGNNVTYFLMFSYFF